MEKSTNFPSRYNIGDTVDFIPMARQCESMFIKQEVSTGTIVSVRFTKAKVFYWIADDYSGYIFEDVDSAYVGESNELNKFLEKELSSPQHN